MVRSTLQNEVGVGLRYALIGAFLGSFAPLGWALVRLPFFAEEEGGFWSRLLGHAFSSGENLALYLYMGGGTALVFGVFGFFIGRASHQIHQRADRLDELNRTIADQKEEFERRFTELNFNLKNFHSANANIQKSLDRREVIQLAADSLHDILRYDRVNILMLNKDRTALEFMASRGAGEGKTSGISLPFDERAGVLAKAVRENRSFLVQDISRMSADFRLKPPCDKISQLRSRSFILCPITLNGEAVGVFGVDNKLKRKTLDDTDVDTVRLFADQVSAALNKIKLLEAVESLTSELEATFAESLKYRDRFSDQLSSLKKGTVSTTETISQIADSSDVIRHAVDDTSSATSEISTTIQEVAQNLGQLAQFMEKSISAMTEITVSIQEVEKNADTSQQLSEKVRQQAEEGARMVGDAFAGLQGISRAVDGAVKAIEFLAQKGEEIDQTLTVINEINQKTNLLSLNASIIAAQAGEHGRSFAVVAEEIRNLSQETAGSAGSIEKVIQQIRTATREAVSHIGETRTLVDAGIDLGKGTGEALQHILKSATPAMEMARDIRKATQEQVRSSQFVSHSIEELGEMSYQVSHASREQAQGIARIVQSIEEIKALAEEMVTATGKHQSDTRAIDTAVDSVGAMAERIFREMAGRQDESRAVIRQLSQLKGASREATSGPRAVAPGAR